MLLRGGDSNSGAAGAIQYGVKRHIDTVGWHGKYVNCLNGTRPKQLLMKNLRPSSSTRNLLWILANRAILMTDKNKRNENAGVYEMEKKKRAQKIA